MVWILLLVVAVAAIYFWSLPAAYSVTRSIVIEKPVADVFSYVRDLKHWTAWSPWALHEPDVKVTLSKPAEVGGSCAWDGQKIGAGVMTHEHIQENQRIDIKLAFLRPFKNTAQVRWAFEETGPGATRMTWSMHAKMPLPMRPLQALFAKMIGYDFALGLALLRGKLDPESEHPALTFDGVVERQTQSYVVERFEGTLFDMRAAMREAYPRLWKNIEKDEQRWEKKPAIAAYHKVQFMKARAVMDMGLAVTHLNEGEAGLRLPAGRYFQMTLRGSYDFLPSSWNTIHGHIKMQKLKIDKRRPALEVYAVNPMEVAHSNGWVTLLCVPIKDK